jgi:hypothetical protein
MPGGVPPADVVAFARALTSRGADALNIGIGWHESPIPTVQAIVPPGRWAPAAAAVRSALVADSTVAGIGAIAVNPRAGVEIRTSVGCGQITSEGVTYTDASGGIALAGADTVIVAIGQESHDDLTAIVRRAGISHYLIGGARDPSGLDAVRAIGDGAAAARKFTASAAQATTSGTRKIEANGTGHLFWVYTAGYVEENRLQYGN